VAENFGGANYLVYAQNTNSVVRTRVPDGFTTTVANFVDLGNLANLSVSVPRGRWYFHYGGQAEFGGTNQTLGFGSATFEVRASQWWKGKKKKEGKGGKKKAGIILVWGRWRRRSPRMWPIRSL